MTPFFFLQHYSPCVRFLTVKNINFPFFVVVTVSNIASTVCSGKKTCKKQDFSEKLTRRDLSQHEEC